ncbi:SACS protein, partial [Atractosteus spatula]|nr:SACS protein [Atractosteus spatula]
MEFPSLFYTQRRRNQHNFVLLKVRILATTISELTYLILLLCLKQELIQNADDACATEVLFIFDERTYGNETLWSEDLREYQGAALYTYNSAVFSDEDWLGIQSTGRSIKRNDPNKVGRFGIGFNSVYHITDLPTIFSARHLGMLDPQETIFGEREGGNIWSLDDSEDREELLSLHDQFQPLKDVLEQVCGQRWEDVISKDQHFSGTLFRFPLRDKPSEISPNLYTSEKITQLFDSFSADADMSLLFLRNVTEVSLIHINSQGSVNVHLKVTASKPHISEILEPRNDVQAEALTWLKHISYHSSDDRETQKQWLVTSCSMKKGHVQQLDSLAEKLCFSPQVSLAFPLDKEEGSFNGRLSCFLPLPNNEPNRTGFPLHVNACFGLTDNRRHIKWQEEDQKYDEAAQWNELLVQTVLPLAYLQIILDAINLSTQSILPASIVYDLWPNISQMKDKEKWMGVTIEIFQHLLQLNVLFLAGDEKQCVKPAEAVFLPPDDKDTSMMKAIADLLIKEGQLLVKIPSHILGAIQSVFKKPQSLTFVTPDFIRRVLHKSNLSGLSNEDKLFLLEYVLSDGCYHDLRGLQLIPVSDGSFRSFGDEFVALIENEEFPRVLLPQFEHLFLPKDIRSGILHHLKKLAENRGLPSRYHQQALRTPHLLQKRKPLTPCHSFQAYYSPNKMHKLHPPTQWLQEFWKFLIRHFEVLEYFVGMPLIPLNTLQNDTRAITLARLMQNTTLVFQNSKQASLSGELAAVVSKAGGTVISERDQCLKHQDLDTYILTPSPRNILQLFLNLGADRVIHGISSSSFEEREKLLIYFSSLESFSNAEKQLLLKLPLFQQMPSIKSTSGGFIAAGSKTAVILNSTPPLPDDLLMPDIRIKCATQAEERILSLMKIILLNTAETATVLVNGIEKGLYDRQETEKIMVWILECGIFLFPQKQDLHRKCRNLCFIVTNGRAPVKASRLFDPCNETFKALFEPEFFPPAMFSGKQEMLDSLRLLGLKSKEGDISPGDVLHVATQISQLHAVCAEKALTKARALIKVLNSTVVLSNFSEPQMQQLLNTQWYPCNSPGTGTENHSSLLKSFYKPKDMRDSKYTNVVGFVMPLTHELTEKASLKLGLLRTPPVEKVFENLSVLITMVNEIKGPRIIENLNVMLHAMYTFMQSKMEQFKNLMQDTDIPWILINGQFVSPQDVVLSHPPNLDLGYYIQRVPEEFLRYRNLLTTFGVKDALSKKEVVDILYHIKHAIDQRHPTFGSSPELKVAISILNWMRKENAAFTEDLPVPVRTGNEGKFNLQPLSSTVFCDITKDGLEDLAKDEEVFHVIHEEIPGVTAKWLGVPLLSTRILNPEFIGIEQCGQTEPITLRIKNILKEYDEEHDLFKELLQNAEDAGAKVCGFMVDNRQNRESSNSLIDPGMSSCHGPCLWAFNNALFTKEDWVNIKRVGSASKDKQVEKIGKFGLGFNAVYHVTDIPSILSGKNILIFDPNITHLEKHILNKGNPGIKLNLFNERLFRRFPGQFRCYQGVYGCNLEVDSNQRFYQGTLIKLPFRTQDEAETSEISKKVYGGNQVHNLVTQLMESSQNFLLFLKNLDKVSLEFLPNTASVPPQHKEIDTRMTVTRQVVTTMNVPDDFPLIKMQLNSLQCLASLNTKYKEVINCFEINIVEVARKTEENELVKYWLLYSCFGMGRSLEMAVTKRSDLSFSLPVGSVAVPLKKDPAGVHWEPDTSHFQGQMFCFLPLSIFSGLPVHVNGSFSVTSNRKNLWKSGIKHVWNQALLEDSVSSAYITVLVVLKKMTQEGKLRNYNYYTFWPDFKKVSTSFQALVVAFYSAVAQNFIGTPVELFSNGQNWCSIDNARFLHPEIEKQKQIGHIALKEFSDKVKKPCLAVPLPEWVRSSFESTGFGKAIQENTFDWFQFYSKVVFNNLHAMDPRNRNALVLHAIDMNHEAINNLLTSHPCIPTQGGRQLQYIGKLVNPAGKVARLYEKEEGRVLEGTSKDFCSPQRIFRLLELGMLSDSLSLTDLVERAETIASVWERDKEKAYKHVSCILELASKFLNDTSSPAWRALGNIPFIPACLPLIVSKGKEAVTLKKPTEVYISRFWNLVNMTQFTVHQEIQYAYPMISHDAVLVKLGALSKPPLYTVLLQLEMAGALYEELDESLLSEVAIQCYKYLENVLKGDKQSHICVNKKAQQYPFILIENKLVSVNTVAKKVSFDARPYLYELPNSFSQFKNLWKCVGLKNAFTSQDYMAVLQSWATKYKAAALPSCDLEICLRIVINGLHEVHDSRFTEYLLPDSRGVLRLSSQLYYNDSPWLPVPESLILCHERISRATALHLKVQTTRHHMLQNHKVSGFSPFASEFGQHEKLTVRLRNIIASYPSKKDILKELVQNSDDAQATEIHFVWDARMHSTRKTFGEKWNQLQGPALCVYNNKVFSEVDLQGIQQLGEGGKNRAPGKIGKYGVGFNSVYHLTDCPAILTGDKWLCISDPHLSYLEQATKEHPGCKFSLETEFKNAFVDVYDTFLPSVFNLTEGTMFRLPIRTDEMAVTSEISNHAVNSSDIKELLEALSEDPEGLILFLQHIRKIEFHLFNKSTNQLQTLFTAELKLSEDSRIKKEPFQKHMQKTLASDFSEGSVNPYQIIYTMEVLSNKKNSQWIVAEQFGVPSQHHCTKNTDCKRYGRIPHGTVAACLNAEIEGKAFCFLPLPGHTGLPVHVNGNFEVDTSRRVLWKEDGKSEKTDWNELLKLCVIAPLYADLLDYIRANNIKGLMLPLDLIGFSLEHFYLRFFPHVSDHVAQEWQGMIHELYKSICKKHLPVVPVLCKSTCQTVRETLKQYTVTWSAFSKPDLAEAPYFTNKESESFLQLLMDVGMNLVPSSRSMDELLKSVRKAGAEVLVLNPEALRNYLKKKLLNDLTKAETVLPLPVSQTLIKNKFRCKTLLDYCLNDINGNNSSTLDGLPLLLTHDGMLRPFQSTAAKFLSKFVKLFQGLEHRFADYSINHSHFDILQNANFLKELTISLSADFLKNLLRTLVQQSEVDSCSSLHILNERLSNWLKLLWQYIEDQVHSAAQKNRKNTFNKAKELLSDSSIIPVICPKQNNKQLLTTMNSLPSVVFDSPEILIAILFKLGFVKVDHSFFSTEFLRCYIMPELLNVADRSAVLEQLYSQRNLEFDKLGSCDLDSLLLYLQSGLSASSNSNTYLSKLKSLPLFETVQGRRQRIDRHRNVFILNTELIHTFSDLYLIDNNSIFLKHTSTNLHLSSSMKIDILNDVEFYVQFILPFLSRLTEAQMLSAVRMLLEIQNNYEDYRQHKDCILSHLRNARFIKDIHGNLQAASYFYDDEVELYRLMLPDVQFIPTEFWYNMGYTHKRVKNLLKDLGFKHAVSEEELIEFAQQIEKDAKRNVSLGLLKRRSTKLLETLLNTSQGELHANGLSRISTIKFVFPQEMQEELRRYHEPFARDEEAVSISGSLIKMDSKSELLIWTSMPILPLVNTTISHVNILKAAGAVCKPPTECVIQNLKTICQVLCQTPAMIQTRAKVLRHSYAFLQTVGFDAQSLTDLPLILVEEDAALVKPSRVVLSVKDDKDFRPYLYKVPFKLAIYIDFFQSVGVAETPSAKHYSSLLRDVYEDSSDKQTLNANQIKTVKRAVEHLFHLLKEEPMERQLEHLKPLYLPATNGKLYKSESLYFNDTAFQVKRCEVLETKLKFLEKLSKCNLSSDSYEQQKLLQMLPKEICPKMLSKVTKEDLMDATLKVCEHGEHCEFRGHFDNHLSSSYFRHGLVCLIRGQFNGSVSESDVVKMCEHMFSKIQIICCETLETVLLLNNEPLSNTEVVKQVYVKRNQNGCTFYLLHKNDMILKVISKINGYLVMEINAFLSNVLNQESLSILGQLLVCENFEDVKNVLEESGIQDSRMKENGQSDLPEPGSIIPDEWIDSLDMDFLNNFEKGEYVGYKKPSSEDEIYCYAVVVEVVNTTENQGGAAFQRYKINIGEDEIIEVSSLDLYQFKRPKRSPCSTRNTCRALVLSEHPSEAPPSSDRTPSKSLEEIKREIDECLKDIWSLLEEERQKAIRRLYLKWHPDKNRECVDLATKVFQYIQQRIKEMEEGQSANDARANNSPFRTQRNQSYGGFYQQWDREASRHKKGRTRFHQRYSSWEYNFWTFHGRQQERSNIPEAQRWFRQAQCDLAAASNDSGDKASEWLFFKVHQAVEKALIAAQYRKNGNQPTYSTITHLAQQVSQYSAKLSILPGSVNMLKEFGVDAKKTQYPSCYPLPLIPNDKYSSQNENQVLELANEVLTKIHEFVSE